MAQIEKDGIYKVTDPNTGAESQLQFTKGHEVGDLEVEYVSEFPDAANDRTRERLDAEVKADAKADNKAAPAPANKAAGK